MPPLMAVYTWHSMDPGINSSNLTGPSGLPEKAITQTKTRSRSIRLAPLRANKGGRVAEWAGDLNATPCNSNVPGDTIRATAIEMKSNVLHN
jgi:hypothetical protein